LGKVKVGVVGVGYFGERHARAYSENPLAELVSIADTNQARAKEVADRYGAASWYGSVYDLLKGEDVDAVSIATPEQQHMEPAVAAAEAGKHVLVEKPLAHNIDDANAIVDAAKRYGVKLMVGYLLRFDPRYAEGKRRIDSGAIGEAASLWAMRASRAGWRTSSWSHPIFYNAIHDLDLINWYVGDDVYRVYAESLSKLLRDKAVPDSIFALMKFKGGAIASLEVNWCRPASWQYQVESHLHVSGTKGVLYVDIYDQGLNIFSEDGHICPDTVHWPVVNNRVVGNLREEINHFLECIIFDREPLVTGLDGIKSLRVALAIIDSLKTESIVAVKS
jgi:predicted dehydrogenase